MFPPGGGDSSQHPAPHHHHHLNRDYPAHIAHPTDEVSGQVEDRFRTARASPGRTYEYRHEPHSPPVRDAASIKGVKYGSGHEKFPSWPTSAAAEALAATRSPPTGGSHRSKSWTDHTHYPKENLILYTRPYMKRHRHQQLKPVFEATDRTMPGPFKGHREDEGSEIFEEDKNYEEREDGFAEKEYGLPPAPGREVTMLQNLDEYSSTYEVKMVIQQEMKTQYFKYQGGKESKKLTQAELEEYTKNYEESLSVQHQKQSSYAQSEGYHSYVSSTDSTSTPFLDRLRREADTSVSRSDSGLSNAVGGAGWDTARGDRDSVVTTSSGSGSSSETLKWHGSLSDISVASSSLSLTSKQLIAHSAKVKTPQRHGSESVLYIARPADSEIEHRAVPPGNCQKHLKLFPVSTYAVPDSAEQRQNCNNRLNISYSPPQMTVAERVNELERQNKYAAYQDSKRQMRVGDPNLKAKQKSALLSFYERQQQKENKQSWRSEPQLASCKPPPPPPQAKPQQTTSRRASSASDYADWRDRDLSKLNHDSKSESLTTPEQETLSHPLNVPNSARFSPNSVLDGPIIIGPVISLDDWVPERPPKNAKLLRNVFPDLYQQDERVPSPDLPLPSPPTVIEDEVCNDEPFPPPPSEITEWKYEQEVPEQLACDNSNIRRSPVAESVTRPPPMCAFSPIKSHDYTHDKLSLHGIMIENARPVKRPTDLPLNATNISPFSQNLNKKLFSNLNEKPLRSSFRTPQDNPLHLGMDQDIRASMRYYRSNVSSQHKSISPPKPAISAQKLLFRSTTVDETPTSPKRPINPFLRSTSLRQNGPCRKSMPPAPQLQKYPSDNMQNARYSSGLTAFNGNTSNSEPPKETTGHYRPECDKSKIVVSKIEQLQQILKGPVERADTKKNESSGILNASVVTSSCYSAKKITNSIPPPLYPKQSVPGVSVKPITSDAGSPHRGNDNVCYAPSRAKLPDPSVGSYKLIQPNEQPPCPKTSNIAELLMPAPEAKSSSYPSFEYITRKTCEKILSLPLEYSKKSTPETLVTPPPSNKLTNYDPNYQDTKTAEKPVEVEEEITKSIGVVEIHESLQSEENSNQLKLASESTTKRDETSNEHEEKVEDNANVQIPPVVVQDEIPAEQYKEIERLQLPEVTQWLETVPAVEEFAQARRLLLEALPADHELRQLVSLTHDQRSPVIFIRDFFGDAPSSGAEMQRPDDGAKAEAVAEAKASKQEKIPPSVEQLKSAVLRCSERLVASLEAASEATSTAMSCNEQLGANILQRLSPPLSAKFTSHHTEVYQISSLMAALSARLARTYDDTERHRPEGKQMEELRLKKVKLEEQLVEARSLKENIDARACTMAEKMGGALDGPGIRDYRLFMAVKPRLIIRARHLQYRLDYERDRLKGLQQSFGDS